jgi:hypothetical protein
MPVLVKTHIFTQPKQRHCMKNINNASLQLIIIFQFYFIGHKKNQSFCRNRFFALNIILQLFDNQQFDFSEIGIVAFGLQ